MRPPRKPAEKRKRKAKSGNNRIEDGKARQAIPAEQEDAQQEEEVQQMKLLNTLLENQKEQFCKIVKEAVSMAQEEAFEKLGVLEKAVQGELSDGGAIAEDREKEEACMEKDLRFAEFYGAFEE